MSKRVNVGGHEIGIAEYDTIMKKALELEHAPEDEIKRVILRELKIYNYVPSSVEQEYLEAMWQAFRKVREERKAR
ncbi:MAG: hypothetical protein ACUVT7_01830 [Thermoplasmata archaeon]